MHIFERSLGSSNNSKEFKNSANTMLQSNIFRVSEQKRDKTNVSAGALIKPFERMSMTNNDQSHSIF